jgi:uncharacterized membrane protein YdjX (TVP38/TMEM64 family)
VSGKQRLLLALIFLLAAAAAGYFSPLAEWPWHFVSWVRSQGIRGVLIYLLVYTSGTPLLISGSILTIGGGFLYGVLLGTLLVSPASVAGATISFLLARSFARGWVTDKISSYPRFAAIDRAVEKHGFKMVLLLRLQPIAIPFVVLNYGLGLTRVRLRDYVVASWVGMLPATIFYVYLGSVIENFSEVLHGGLPSSGPWGRVFFWGGLAATLALVWLLGRITKAAFEAELGNDAETAGAGERRA